MTPSFFGSKIMNLLVFFILSRKSVSGSRLHGVCMGRSGTSASALYALFSHFCYVGGFGDLSDPVLPTLYHRICLLGYERMFFAVCSLAEGRSKPVPKMRNDRFHSFLPACHSLWATRFPICWRGSTNPLCGRVRFMHRGTFPTPVSTQIFVQTAQQTWPSKACSPFFPLNHGWTGASSGDGGVLLLLFDIPRSYQALGGTIYCPEPTR